MPTPQQIAMARLLQQQSLRNSVPVPGTPASNAASVPSLGENIEQASYGLGDGLTTQLEGLYQLASHPVQSAKAIYQVGKSAVQDPAAAAKGMGNFLKETAQTAVSSPYGMGQVIGENLGLRPRPSAGMMRDMTVYHGSPHEFDEFDLKKIGTGEGAQAYGHGLYFAENPDVAKTYKQAPQTGNMFGNWQISDAAKKDLYGFRDQFSAKGDGYTAGIVEELTVGDFPPDVLRKQVSDALRYGEITEVDKKAALDAITEAEAIANRHLGKLYDVDIPDESIEKMLDWDKPLSEQPASIRDALQKTLVKDANPDGLDMGGGKVLDNRNRQAAPDKSYPWVLKSGNNTFGLSQGDVDRMLGAHVQELSGNQLYTRLTASLGSQAAASEALKQLGIPGIRYLDGGSRADGAGTRNFVVFDDKIPKILKRE